MFSIKVHSKKGEEARLKGGPGLRRPVLEAGGLGCILPLLLVVLFFVHWLVGTVVWDYADIASAPSWPTVVGKRVEKTKDYSNQKAREYAYTVDGKEYVNDDVWVLGWPDSDTNPKVANQAYSRPFAKEPLKVYYHPDNPQKSCLVPYRYSKDNIATGGACLRLLLGTFLLGFGLLFASFQLRGWFAKRLEESTPTEDLGGAWKTFGYTETRDEIVYRMPIPHKIPIVLMLSSFVLMSVAASFDFSKYTYENAVAMILGLLVTSTFVLLILVSFVRIRIWSLDKTTGSLRTRGGQEFPKTQISEILLEERTVREENSVVIERYFKFLDQENCLLMFGGGSLTLKGCQHLGRHLAGQLETEYRENLLPDSVRAPQLPGRTAYIVERLKRDPLTFLFNLTAYWAGLVFAVGAANQMWWAFRGHPGPGKPGFFETPLAIGQVPSLALFSLIAAVLSYILVLQIMMETDPKYQRKLTG